MSALIDSIDKVGLKIESLKALLVGAQAVIDNLDGAVERNHPLQHVSVLLQRCVVDAAQVHNAMGEIPIEAQSQLAARSSSGLADDRLMRAEDLATIAIDELAETDDPMKDERMRRLLTLFGEVKERIAQGRNLLEGARS